MSSNRDVFFPSSSESRAKIYKATGGTAGQMERREDVSLIDAAERGGRSRVGWRWWWGGGEFVKQCQNHRHICCSSPTFPPSFQRFLPPCKVYRAATAGWRVFHKRLPLLFSLLAHKLPKRARKEKAMHSTG